MRIGRELIELCVSPYKHLKSSDYHKSQFCYKLGYSIGIYAETLMFYGSLEQKYKGLQITKSTLDYSPNKQQLIYIKQNKEAIRKRFEKDINIVFDLYEKK